MEVYFFFIFKMDLSNAIYHSILCIAFIVALVVKSSDRAILLLRVYLVLTFLIEMTALYIRYLGEYNSWVYNIWVLISVPIFIKIIFSQLKNKTSLAENILFFTVIVFYLLNLFFFQGFHIVNTYSVQFGAIIIIILTLLHFKALLDSPEKPLIDNPHFYISIALLMFYAGTFTYYSFFNFLIRVDMVSAQEITIVLLLLNYLTYSLFAIAILLQRKKQLTHVRN
ncbi:hypothetical protein JKA74_06900 [Marivirga sp. S37H4]|uniref:Uncharacterized protein n=1 Tax=Marivirga aurantiaca TaxID=2802615 RepID=A0A935C783_9BACT|nr:hypothetical protein [Marivirga aurantiaca]MBK6264759.1 hypothetical protein [Marivirga aurantiaca]